MPAKHFQESQLMLALIIILIVISPLLFVLRPNPRWRWVATRKRAGLTLAVTFVGGVLVFFLSAIVVGVRHAKSSAVSTGASASSSNEPQAAILKASEAGIDLSEAVTAPDPQPASPGAPYYKAQDGAGYIYTTFVSDQDAKTGKVPVSFSYDYLGKSGHIYAVQTTAGSLTATAKCSASCQVLDVTVTTFNLPVGAQKVPFDVRTVVGRVMADAIAGKLTAHGSNVSGSDDSTSGANETPTSGGGQ